MKNPPDETMRDRYLSHVLADRDRARLAAIRWPVHVIGTVVILTPCLLLWLKHGRVLEALATLGIEVAVLLAFRALTARSPRKPSA